MCAAVIERHMHTYLGENKRDWELEEFTQRVNHSFNTELDHEPLTKLGRDEFRKVAMDAVQAVYDSREEAIEPEKMRQIERFLLLNVIDSKWKDHLRAMTQLREQVGLRGYAQVDPKNEYKREGWEHFQQLLEGITTR